MEDRQSVPYEKPQLLELGSIETLTLNKKLGAGDGFLFVSGQPPTPIQNT
jgi:hypothetical protein